MIDVMQLAEQAGMVRDGGVWFSPGQSPYDEQDVTTECLERFAALVEAATLERAAQECDSIGHHWSGQAAGVAFDAAESIRALKPKE